MGGRYPLSYLAFDVVAFGTVIAALRLFDRLLRAGADRLLGQETRGRRLVARAAHATILGVVAFPFILVTLQLHPLRIATTGTPQAAGLVFAEVRFSADGRSLAGWHIPAGRAMRRSSCSLTTSTRTRRTFFCPRSWCTSSVTMS
jgi:hypothetical protein